MVSLRDLPIQRGDGLRLLVRAKMLWWWARGVGADHHAAVVLARYPAAHIDKHGAYYTAWDGYANLNRQGWPTMWGAWAHARARIEVGA